MTAHTSTLDSGAMAQATLPETKHTPDRWTASVEEKAFAPGSYFYVVLDENEDGIGEFYGSDHEENVANLRLACRAPDLLKASRAVVKLIEGFPGYGTATNLDGRLKDQAAWVEFYNLIAALSEQEGR